MVWVDGVNIIDDDGFTTMTCDSALLSRLTSWDWTCFGWLLETVQLPVCRRFEVTAEFLRRRKVAKKKAAKKKTAKKKAAKKKPAKKKAAKKKAAKKATAKKK